MGEAGAQVLAALEIMAAAGDPGSLEERGVAILESLRKAVPFDVACLLVRDPERRRHSPVAMVGPGDALRRYFLNCVSDAEVDSLGLNDRRSPLRAADLPVPMSELQGWTDYLWPAGLHDGLATGLFATAERHVGMVALLRESRNSLTLDDCDVVERLSPSIAAALDRQQTLAAAARIIRGAIAGAVLTRAGAVLPLDGLARHPLLSKGSPVLAVVADRLDHGDHHLSFLVSVPGARIDSTERLLRVTALNCVQTIDHLRAVAVLSEPFGLPSVDHTDLRTLGALTEGWPAARTAAAAGVSAGELTERVRQLISTVGAGSIPALVSRALREGLYIPPTLPGRWV